MPEVSRTLRLYGSKWRDSQCQAIVCNYWLRRRYVLDSSQPLRMVFSTDLKTKDAYVVNEGETEAYPLVMPTQGGHVVETHIYASLVKFLQQLRERWGQGRIAIWFEQDWTEED